MYFCTLGHMKKMLNFLVHFLGHDPTRSIPPTMTQHGNSWGGGGTSVRMPAAFHASNSDRSEEQKHLKHKGREGMKAEEGTRRV